MVEKVNNEQSSLKRLIKLIESQIIQYAIGNFKSKINVDLKNDKLDTVVIGINMLGEELYSRTISRDYFENIFNVIDEGILITDVSGKVLDCNKAATTIFEYSQNDLTGKKIHRLINIDFPDFVEIYKNDNPNFKFKKEARFINKNGQEKHIEIFIIKFDNSTYEKSMLVRIVDISEKVGTQKRIVSAVIRAQENERNRISEDLHDSIGQHLIALSMQINVLKSTNRAGDKHIFEMMQQNIQKSINEIRYICYNQMPETLKKYGYKKAMIEFANSLKKSSPINIQLEIDFSPLHLLSEFEIALYRISQEFIQNSMRYNSPQKIKIATTVLKDDLLVELSDDGVGFDMANIMKKGEEMQNILSRIQVYDGRFSMKSKDDSGIQLTMKFQKSNVEKRGK